MAITVPGSFTTAALPTTATPGADIYDVLVPHITAFKTTGVTVPAWEVYDQLDARDVVLLSRGDRRLGSGAGDTKIYVRIDAQTNAATLRITMHGDWSTVSSTGQLSTTVDAFSPGTTDPISLWIATNEYESVLVLERGTFRDGRTWGQAQRFMIPPAHKGTAFSTGSVAGGPNVIIPVDRDMTGLLQVGEQCWKVPQTATGSGLTVDTIEIGTVQAITTTTVELDITKAEPGDLIGCYPQPVYRGDADAVAGSSNFFIYDTAGGAAPVASNASSYSGNISSQDPNTSTGFASGAANLVRDNAVAEYYMGSKSLIHAFAASGADTMAGDDPVRVHYHNGLRFWLFPLLGTSGSWTTAVGPLEDSI